ncbi:MAG: SDR family oxidoreductase [Gammaproteobacteria bacterium]|nr:SDR family oxidoreductase [Gammaproteobacteria bacterium]
MSDFTGKRVLVTGAAGVAGRAVATAFQTAGATVTGVDIVEDDAPWRTLIADLIDPDGARTAVAEAGVIDVLANIAGGFTMGDDIVGTSDDTWDFMMNLNARTALNMCRAAVPGMVGNGGGKIVNIGARGGLRGAAAMGAYVASKSVVIRLTETLADELKHKGINVNCILPSIIDTPRNRADMPKAKFDHWVSPQAIADVVLFLSSPAADAIHGAAIPVEGLS